MVMINKANFELPQTERLRRTGILCLCVLRNLAFYRGGWDGDSLKLNSDLGRTMNANFIDMAFLEWGKLFFDSKGSHHWCRVVSSREKFLAGMLKAVGLTDDDFDRYLCDVKTYRDKFLAHLDKERVMHIPKTIVAHDTTVYLFNYLRDCEEIEDCFSDVFETAEIYYERMAAECKAFYDRLQ